MDYCIMNTTGAVSGMRKKLEVYSKKIDILRELNWF